MVGDGEIREKHLSTTCFIRSDNNKNFLTMVQDLSSSLPCPLLKKKIKKKKCWEKENKKINLPDIWLGED